MINQKHWKSLFPSFSPDLPFYGKFWLFYAQKWISLKKLGTLLNPLTPENFAKKCLLKRFKPLLGRCLAKKNGNCAKPCIQVEHYTSFRSWRQITACEVRACAEIKILRESFASLSSFTYCVLSSPLLLLFFPHFFCWAFTRLAFGGKRFCKKFEDREFFLKEVRVGSGTRFSLEFSGQSYTVFCVFLWSVSLNRAHLGMDWKISSPCIR